MDWKDALQKIGVTLKESAVEFIEQHCKEEVASAKAIQRNNDIVSAIMGFIDLKATDMQILELLQKYFMVESISEGQVYIVNAHCYYQCDKLKAYLGLIGVDWIRYKNDNSVLEKLKSNPKLLDMSVEKLKAAIEK